MCELDKNGDSVTATLDDGKGGRVDTAERVIFAIGIIGNAEDLGLEELGVKIERGPIASTILPDRRARALRYRRCRRSADARAQGKHEGIVCVETIDGLKPHPIDKTKIPGCTYCSPQIATVGLTEAACKAKRIDIRVGRFPFR